MVSTRFRPFTRGFAAALSAAVLLVASAASAQAAPDLPRPSPAAQVQQRVGITDFSVKYQSPAVRGRTIYGGLVPYGELWRAGADASTLLSSSHEFRVGDVTVPAGTYSVFAIPGEEEWTIVLNSNTKTWGTNGYQQSEDVARITVKPTALAEPRERMTFLFSNTTADSADLDLEWANLRVRIPLSVETTDLTVAGIDQFTEDNWQPYNQSARWLLESGGDLDKALDLVNLSLVFKATWSNNWVKAQILAKQGKTGDAREHAVKAQRLGGGDYIYETFYKTAIGESVAAWK